jgi:hypothetical protein
MTVKPTSYIEPYILTKSPTYKVASSSSAPPPPPIQLALANPVYLPYAFKKP